jgi:hypothetical protein
MTFKNLQLLGGWAAQLRIRRKNGGDTAECICKIKELQEKMSMTHSWSS